jgi:hypothetical protein
VSARTQRRSVIAAFPATGETYIAGRDHRFADSDSSGFSWESPGVRNPEWPANYMAHIKGLIADGRHVLCSTHQEVRDALVDAGLPFTLVYPAEDQRIRILAHTLDALGYALQALAETSAQGSRLPGGTAVLVIRLAFLIWGAALGGFCRDFNRRAWTFWDGMRREIGRKAA